MAVNCMKDMRLFVIFFSAMLFVDILAGVYLRSAFTTIERRFGLSTTKLALLSSAYQVGNLAVVIFVSYYGSRSHRPRFIAFGSGLVALGYFVSSLPQFIGDRYEYVDATKSNDSDFKAPICSSEVTNTSAASCNDLSNSVDGGSNLYIWIVAGSLLSGIGSAPLQPLGMSYIDDFSERRKSPVYIGIVMTISLIGPAFGYLLGSAVLRLWVDVGWVDSEEITISPKDHNWVGAWWLGTLLGAVLITIATIPLCFFPRKMAITYKKKNLSSVDNDDTDFKEEHVHLFKNNGGKESIFISAKKIFSSRLYLLVLAMWIFGGLNVVGIITFFPKYLEVQFGVSASAANMYYGAIGIPCLAVGTLLGSYIMKRLNPKLVGMAKLIMVVRVITTTIGFSFLFIGCDSVDIVGVNAPYVGSSGSSDISTISYCNDHCNCNEAVYAPICGADGMSYVSACHAGCNGTLSTVEGVVLNYTDCSCINPDSDSKQSHWSHPGLCTSTRCGQYAMIVLGIMAFVSFIGGIAATPSYVFMMRTVPQKEKAFAIGLAFMSTRLLAWLPGPLMYGKVIDSTCSYWSGNGCGDEGYCRVYDNDSFRFRYFGVQTCAEIVASFCAIAVYVLAKNRKEESDLTKEAEKDILLMEPCNSRVAAARLASTSTSSSENLDTQNTRFQTAH